MGFFFYHIKSKLFNFMPIFLFDFLIVEMWIFDHKRTLIGCHYLIAGGFKDLKLKKKNTLTQLSKHTHISYMSKIG